MAHLKMEYEARGRSEVFQALLPFLLEKQGSQSHAELGRHLNLSENSVTQEISRLRRRYRTVFDSDLEKLVGNRAEVAEEKRLLLSALRS